MKAIMILIVAAGTAQGSALSSNRNLDVREIEFSTMEACRQAAAQLVDAGRKNVYWAREFATETSTRKLLTPAPIVMAECIKT
jgi:tRNA A37 threonylcarbamoyladenosine modification protein TsaB